MKYYTRIIACLISLLFPYTAWAQNAVNGTGQLISGGRTRTFVYHLPPNYKDNLPLLIGYHGNYSSGAIFQMYTGLDAVADSQNFIIAYPDADTVDHIVRFNYYADDAPGFGAVADPDGPGQIDPNASDDIQFTADLIDYFIKTYHVDRSRVYATGHSSGGVMCYHASVKLANRIAAFVPVASNLWGNKKYLNNYFTGNKYVQTAILHIQSAGDIYAPSPIPSYPKPAADVWPLSTFARLNGNTTGSYTTNILSDFVDSLTFCGSGKKVILLMTKDATHSWSSQFNTAQVLWNFVKNFQLNSPDEDSSKQLVITPNPAKASTVVRFILAKQKDAILSVFSLSGIEVRQQPVTGTGDEQQENIDLSDFPKGLYIIKLKNSYDDLSGKVLIEP